MEDCIFNDDFFNLHNNSANEYQDDEDNTEKYSMKNDYNELGNSLQTKDFDTSESKINLPLAANERKSVVKEDNDINEGSHISLLKELEDKWSYIETNQKRHKSRDNNNDNNIDSTSRTSSMFNHSMQNWKNAIEESKRKYYRKKVRKNKEGEDFGDFIREKTKELKNLTIGNIQTNNTSKHPEKINNKFRMTEYNNTYSTKRDNNIIKNAKKERTFLINTPHRMETTNQHKPKLFTFGTQNNNEQMLNKITIPSLLDNNNHGNIKQINQDNQYLISKIKDIYTELTETSEPPQLYNNGVIQSGNNKRNLKDISLFDLNKNFHNYFNVLSSTKKLPINNCNISPRNKSYNKDQTHHQSEINKNSSFSCVSNNRIKSKIIENSKLISHLLPKSNNKRQNHLYKAFNNAKFRQDKPIKMYDKNNFNDTEKTLLLINSPTINKIMQQ
jgi:hypothetical protein